MRRVAFVFILLGLASSASAVKVGDITRLSGERSNVLTGLGLIVGLRGTGDGGGFSSFSISRRIASSLLLISSFFARYASASAGGAKNRAFGPILGGSHVRRRNDGERQGRHR